MTAKSLIYILLFALLCAPSAFADNEGGDEAEIRENPDIEAGAPAAAAVHIPAYIRQNLNTIDLNGADWSRLARDLAAGGQPASIVHIGDSHLQADFATAVVRERLQQRYGSGGRGLIIPFRMAGTNEPRDYVLNSPDGFVASRLLKQPWPTDMAFTGVAVEPVDHSSFRLHVKAGEVFDALTFHSTAPGLKVSEITAADSGKDFFTDRAEGNALHIGLMRPASEVTATLSAPRGLAIGGIELRQGNKGVAYHVIGNNGATYATYTTVGDMGAGVAALHPRLIIVSLGTNEAFGKVSTEAFTESIDALLGELRRHNPEAELLLVTPAECQRRSTRRVAGKGRKGRRRSRTVSSYAVNGNIARLRQAIVDYGQAHGVPVYDWYAVAGGNGSSARWLADGLLGRDRIHLTAAGYRLQGELTAQALINTLTSTISPNPPTPDL